MICGFPIFRTDKPFFFGSLLATSVAVRSSRIVSPPRTSAKHSRPWGRNESVTNEPAKERLREGYFFWGFNEKRKVGTIQMVRSNSKNTADDSMRLALLHYRLIPELAKV